MFENYFDLVVFYSLLAATAVLFAHWTCLV